MSWIMRPSAGIVAGASVRVRTKSVTSARGSAIVAGAGASAGAYDSTTWPACAETAMKSCTSDGVTARLRAYAVGTVPTRISMMRPIPFCPSFEPCAKLTPVHVSISRERIQNGGGSVPSGAS